MTARDPRAAGGDVPADFITALYGASAAKRIAEACALADRLQRFKHVDLHVLSMAISATVGQLRATAIDAWTIRTTEPAILAPHRLEATQSIDARHEHARRALDWLACGGRVSDQCWWNRPDAFSTERRYDTPARAGSPRRSTKDTAIVFDFAAERAARRGES